MSAAPAGPAQAAHRPDTLSVMVLLAPLAAALGCWALALGGTDLDRISGLGLLNALPPAYYVALALLTAGFAGCVMTERVHVGIGLLYLVALVFVIHGTPAVLYEVPRYAWTYKHLGVIELIERIGAPSRDLDIYANWPAFFGLNAWFADAAGVRALHYAQWAQVFFNLTYVAGLLFVFRTLTTSPRIILVGIWLFLLGNWIGQDFLAPQALAFLGFLALAGLYLRAAPAPRPARTRAARWLVRQEARLRRWLLPAGAPVPPERAADLPRLPPRLALGVGGVIFVAIVISHQLTPVVLILIALALAVVVRRLPLWVPAAMIVVEGVWLLAARTYLSANYNIFDFNRLSRPRPTGADPANALAGVEFVARGAQLTVVFVTLIALLGLARRLRAGRWDIELAVMIAAPVVVIPIQSYGGEAPLRIYLFALPWLAFLGAVALTPGTSAWRRSTRLGLATVLVGGSFLLAHFGLEKMNRITADDVRAAAWIERSAPRGTLVTYVAPNFPVRATGRYPEVVQGTDLATRELLRSPVGDEDPAGQRRWAERELRELGGLQAEKGAPTHFVVISPSQANYLQLYGLANPGSIAALNAAIEASPDYRLVFRSGGARVYRWAG